MAIECEIQESGEYGGLWKAHVKGIPEATGYGYSKAEAARAAIDNIVPAMNAEISRLRAENDKANKGLERAGEIETTLCAALREAEEEVRTQRDRADSHWEQLLVATDKLADNESSYNEAYLIAVAAKNDANALREALAESQARAARLEAKGQDLRDSLVKIRCADCAEHGYTPEKMDCPVCAEGMRRIWDWYAALASGPSALEAVRGAVAIIEDTWGKDSPTAQALRTAFGLAGEERT